MAQWAAQTFKNFKEEIHGYLTTPFRALDAEKLRRRSSVMELFPKWAFLIYLAVAVYMEQSDKWGVTRTCDDS